MCGIAGILDFSGGSSKNGAKMLAMLRALCNRGPDSVGVALYTTPTDSIILRVKAGETEIDEKLADTLFETIGEEIMIFSENAEGAYLRLEVSGEVNTAQLATKIQPVGGELVSAGNSLEILKQTGSPDALEATFKISNYKFSHALGHTRMSTESKIDLSHSQPFWAVGAPDVAIVHNGHITNYHKLRRIYEEKGVHFTTENDSEVIGIYLRDRLSKGDSLAGALENALRDLDGSFCFLASTANQIGFVKDPYGFKPLVVAQTDEFVAIATEEIAIRAAFGEGFKAKEAAARSLMVWDVKTAALV